MTTAPGGADATRPVSFAGWFMGSGDSKSSALLLVPCCTAIVACLLFPLAYVLALSFNPARPGEVELTGTVTFSNYARLFLNWFYLRVLLKTVWIAGLTTFLCGVFGIVLALAIWRSSRRTHGFIVIVVLSPLLVSI